MPDRRVDRTHLPGEHPGEGVLRWEPTLLKVNPYFTKTLPLAASGVNMLRLCVDDVLADD
jgi:hypothetical protein